MNDPGLSTLPARLEATSRKKYCVPGERPDSGQRDGRCAGVRGQVDRVGARAVGDRRPVIPAVRRVLAVGRDGSVQCRRGLADVRRRSGGRCRGCVVIGDRAFELRVRKRCFRRIRKVDEEPLVRLVRVVAGDFDGDRARRRACREVDGSAGRVVIESAVAESSAVTHSTVTGRMCAFDKDRSKTAIVDPVSPSTTVASVTSRAGGGPSRIASLSVEDAEAEPSSFDATTTTASVWPRSATARRVRLTDRALNRRARAGAPLPLELVRDRLDARERARRGRERLADLGRAEQLRRLGVDGRTERRVLPRASQPVAAGSRRRRQACRRRLRSRAAVSAPPSRLWSRSSPAAPASVSAPSAASKQVRVGVAR